MAERVEKRRKIAPRAFGLADLPPDIVIRIAAKLDLTPDIRNFSSSCANTRDCLGAEAWTDLISRKFGDFNIKHPFPSWFPHFLWYASSNTPLCRPKHSDTVYGAGQPSA